MSDDGEDRILTLQEAADRLKVHYMTAYRWVRRGDLPAFKTGGRLRVREADLEQFVTERQVEVAVPTQHGGRTDWELHVSRLHALLLEGRAADATALTRKVVADGAPTGDVYVRLLTPALHRVGEDWEAGRISVAEEHRATEIAKAIIARLGEAFRRRGPSRGTAVTLTPPGELHGLASAMVADFLRGGGFDVHHLGANVPVADLRMFLQVVPCDVVAISATAPETLAGTLTELVEVARQSGVQTVVLGGQGAAEHAATEAGAAYVEDPTALAERVAELLAAARPTRDRAAP